MKPDFTEIEFHEYFATMAPHDVAFLKKNNNHNKIKKVELEFPKIHFCVM